MSTFDARLRVPGQARLPLNVVVAVEDEKIGFTTGDKPLGDWRLSDVAVEVRSDGFHLTFDNEEIVLTVTDPAGFARALGVGVRRPDPFVGQPTANGTPATNGSNGSKKNILSSRLEGVTPEERFADVIGRITNLKTMLTDDSVPPQEVFSRWLRLLKELNMLHGQGAMPTPLFYELNSELLETLPAPARRPRPEPEPVGAGVSV